MFGYLRFFLAFLVMLSHIGVKFYTLNPGVIAVVIFYILAGYVVSHLIRDIFSRHCEPTCHYEPSSHCERSEAISDCHTSFAVTTPVIASQPVIASEAKQSTTPVIASQPVIASEAKQSTTPVIARSLRRSNPQTKQSTTTILLSFYKDRILRIFPLYIYVIILTTLFLLLTSFANPHFTFLNVLNNITIIPLNYYMYIDSTILTNPSWWLIPPAWSLGTELQAYILLPFALMFKRVKISLALISFSIYVIANFSIIHPDYFGYRFLAGVFFIFLLGSSIQRFNKSDKYFISFIYISILILVPIFSYTDSFSPTYTKETFIGVLVGVPLVLLLSSTKKKLPLNRFFGDFSYAVFLTHFLSIWILDYLGISASLTFTYQFEVAFITFFIAAFIIILPSTTRRRSH